MIYPTTPPEVGPNQEAIPALPIVINGRRTQQWEVIDKPVDPAVRIPYQTLYLLLLASPAYAGFLSRAKTVAAPPAMGVAMTELSDALTQARFGTPIVPALMAALASVLAVGGFTATELGGIQAILSTAGLSEVFDLNAMQPPPD
jgi:hypothetical protein